MRNRSVSDMALTTLVGVGALLVVAAAGELGMRSPTIAAAQAATSTAGTVLHTAAGDEVGRATFTADADHVVVDVSASGLTPGFHGFHVHSVGQCVAPDFTSAGGHFNTMDMANMTQPMHSGDLPSLLANQDGTAQMRTVTDRFSIDDLLAGSGTALIIHAGSDNFANIPARYAPAPDAMTLATGDAGARFACGVIQGQ
jgi:superoxide dismutase, Cu-Zn family